MRNTTNSETGDVGVGGTGDRTPPADGRRRVQSKALRSR